MLTMPLQVLLIEDDDEHCEIIRRRLNKASGGAVTLDRTDRLSAGFERLSRRAYDAVLLDLCLPDSQGLETCRRLAGQMPGTPFVVLSSMELDPDGDSAELNLLASGFVCKSGLDGPELLESLQNAAKRSRTNRRAGMDSSRNPEESIWDHSSHVDVRPPVPGFRVAGETLTAADDAGERFDWLKLPDGDTLVLIGDASNNGASARSVMNRVSSAVRTFARVCDEAGGIMSRVNSLLCQEAARGRSTTLASFRICDTNSTIRYCSAGRTCALLFNRDGGLVEQFRSTSLPIGVLKSAEFRESPPCTMNPGDILVLVSDGVTGCQSVSREEFGQSRLTDVVRANILQDPDRICARILASARKHRSPLECSGDMTAVVIRKDQEPRYLSFDNPRARILEATL